MHQEAGPFQAQVLPRCDLGLPTQSPEGWMLFNPRLWRSFTQALGTPPRPRCSLGPATPSSLLLPLAHRSELQ